MTKTHKILLAIAATAAFVLLAYVWHRAEVEAAADKATLNAQLKAQADKIESLAQNIKDRDAKATADKKDVDTKISAARTPTDQAALIQLFAGMSKPPVTITMPAQAQPGAPAQKELPSDPVGTVNRQQLADWATFAGTCKKCEIDRDTAQADIKTKDGIIAQKDKDIADLKQYNAGGSKTDRMKRAGKWMLVGGVSVEIVRIVLKGKL